MGLFDRRHRSQQMGSGVTARRSLDAPASNDPRRAPAAVRGPGVVRWRFIVETLLVGLGATVLSFLVIWATVTNRLSIEAIVVLSLTLILGLFAVGQATKYSGRGLSLHEGAREAVSKTTKAVEIMMEFLREFTLKNQETISQMVDSQKGRVIDELGKVIDDLARTTEDARLRRELAQLKETIGRKILEIPSGVAFPLPRLEHFDAALASVEEPERTPICPACGAAQARVSTSDRRGGIQYSCLRCGHEFNVGITVVLEKNT